MATITDYTKAGVDAAIAAAPTKAHKTTHATGGTDAITPADIGAQPAGSYAAASHTQAASTISDSTAVGRSVLTATDAAAARTAIGAGTSSLVLGTTAGTAKAGDYAPDLSGYVPTSRTVNGKALTGNITLSAGDVGASTFSGAYADLSGKPTLGTAADNADTDFATAAQGSKADETYAGTQPVNAQTGTTYTLQASDAGKLVTLTNAAAITLTIPGNVFTVPAGKVVRVDCLVAGAGMVTGVGSSCTVTGTPSLVSRAQWSAFTVLFTSATTAVLIGDLA